jgi:hypothetical protein
MVREIVVANNWERPIYFAVTCSEDSKIGLSDYLKMEGMALRLVPEKRKSGEEFLNVDLLQKELFDFASPLFDQAKPHDRELVRRLFLAISSNMEARVKAL